MLVTLLLYKGLFPDLGIGSLPLGTSLQQTIGSTFLGGNKVAIVNFGLEVWKHRDPFVFEDFNPLKPGPDFCLDKLVENLSGNGSENIQYKASGKGSDHLFVRQVGSKVHSPLLKQIKEVREGKPQVQRYKGLLDFVSRD